MIINALKDNVVFDGLNTGLDSSAIIKNLIKIAEAPATRLSAQEVYLQSHVGIYSNISSLLQTWSTSIQGMQTAYNFSQEIATSSDTSVISATAQTGALTSNYSVVVNSIAQAQRNYSNGYISSSTSGLVGSGNLTIQVGTGAATTIAIDSSMALQDVANSINNAGAGVVGSITYDGTDYYLVLSGTATGADNSITYTESGTLALNLQGTGSSGNSNQVLNAQNSKITVDNIITAESNNNAFDNVIQGVSLQVVSQSTTSQTINVAVDSAAIQSNVQGFIDGYNSVITAINAAITYKGYIDPSILVGDPVLQSMENDMQNIIANILKDSPSIYQSLSEIGISTQKDGTLALDADAFQGALANDYAGVTRLFIHDRTYDTYGAASQAQTLINDYNSFTGGLMTLVKNDIKEEIKDMDEQIQRIKDNAANYENILKEKYYNLEVAVGQFKTQKIAIESLQHMNFNKR